MMDDKAIIRSAAGKVLVRIGYEVEYAKDGEEAIDCRLAHVTLGRLPGC